MKIASTLRDTPMRGPTPTVSQEKVLLDIFELRAGYAQPHQELARQAWALEKAREPEVETVRRKVSDEYLCQTVYEQAQAGLEAFAQTRPNRDSEAGRNALELSARLQSGQSLAQAVEEQFLAGARAESSLTAYLQPVPTPEGQTEQAQAGRLADWMGSRARELTAAAKEEQTSISEVTDAWNLVSHHRERFHRDPGTLASRLQKAEGIYRELAVLEQQQPGRLPAILDPGLHPELPFGYARTLQFGLGQFQRNPHVNHFLLQILEKTDDPAG